MVATLPRFHHDFGCRGRVLIAFVCTLPAIAILLTDLALHRGVAVANFTYFGHGKPCPLCGQTKECRQSHGTGAVFCRNTTDTPAGWTYGGEDRHGFSVYFAEDGTPHDLGRVTAEKHREAARLAANRVAKSAARAEGRSARDAVEALATAPLSGFARIDAESREPTENETNALASNLGLTASAFGRLGMRFRPRLHGPGGHRAAFVFPERDGTGKTTGLNLRHVDGSKLTYGPRGLFIPDDLGGDGTDPLAPVICCEGVSDTAALVAMSLNGIGRPNNSYGGEQFGGWLQLHGYAAGGPRETAPIIVVGENDAKIGGDWPGRDGAEHVAPIVAGFIARPVLVAYPPVEVKDVRDYVKRHHDELRAGMTTLSDLGELLVEHLTITAYAMDVTGVIDPATAPPLDPTGGDIIAAKVSILASAGVKLQPGEMPTLGPGSDECDYPRYVWFRHRTKPKRMYLAVPCRRLTCAGCLRAHRERWRATVQHHLGVWRMPVHKAFVSDAGWIEGARLLRARASRGVPRAEFFRLNDGTGSSLVVSTRPAADGAVELAADIAAARLSYVLGVMPVRPGVKPLVTSVGWPLLADRPREKPSEWELIGIVSTAPADTASIFDHHRADWAPFDNRGIDPTRYVHGMVVNEHGVDMDHLEADLQIGYATPAIGGATGFEIDISDILGNGMKGDAA